MDYLYLVLNYSVLIVKVIKMQEIKIYKTIDLTGQSCAGPLGELIGVMDEIVKGEAVEVIVDPRSDTKDKLLEWVKNKGYKIVSNREESGRMIVVIGK